MLGFGKKKLIADLQYSNNKLQVSNVKLCVDNMKLTDTLDAYRSRFFALLEKHNKLVSTINDKGGQQFLDGKPQFTQDEIRTLITLCHPDKHNNKESAKTVTQKLLAMRN